MSKNNGKDRRIETLNTIIDFYKREIEKMTTRRLVAKNMRAKLIREAMEEVR